MGMRESGEMYLETIYILGQKASEVRAIDVGEYMGFSKPSVSRGMKLLRERGLITVDDSGFIRFTENGLAEAERIYDRHTTLTAALVMLGVDEKTAAVDACKMEHYISEDTFQAIKTHIAETSK